MKDYRVYFIIPEHEDYDTWNAPIEQTIVSGFDVESVTRKFMLEIPEAYIKEIFELEY